MITCSIISLLAVIISLPVNCFENVLERNRSIKIIDVEELSGKIYGSELLLLNNELRNDIPYRFEDFFWTGSGDGSIEESTSENHWETSTIYKTKTTTSTVFIETPHTTDILNQTQKNCSLSTDCMATPSIPAEDIHPTPTQTIETTTSIDNEEDDFNDADREFWLITVLKSDGKDPIIADLKKSLAKLYKIAFERQHERHLGIINNRLKRQTVNKPVKVYIHKVDKTSLDGKDKIEVLYHVTVDGKPVPAFTAAEDMKLVSDSEVREELGYPFLIKAEPYLKPSETLSLANTNSTWIFIGSSIVGLLLLLLVMAFLILACSKKKSTTSSAGLGLDNRQHIFERGVAGHDNKGFLPDNNKTTKNNESPTYINFKSQTLNTTTTMTTNRSQSSLSSSCSSTSLDISPLMHTKKQIVPPKKPPRPRAAYNKTVPVDIKKIPDAVYDSDSAESLNKRDSPDNACLENMDPGVVSPTSYLSMPSVKSFPRSSMPEPLSKVLEPVSVLHLDMYDDDIFHQPTIRTDRTKTVLTRHGSVGAVEDQGVIGPIVWNMHKERLSHGVSMDEGIEDLRVTQSVSKMRKRFHDLLDDTFSLFGSRRASPIEETRPIPIEVKSHSAINRLNDDSGAPLPKPRPKTTDYKKRPQPTAEFPEPRGAWSSGVPSPLVRPVSAGIIYHPHINVDHVLAEGYFRQNDPAIPLIAAIKSEIEKCSLPGSTTDLR